MYRRVYGTLTGPTLFFKLTSVFLCTILASILWYRLLNIVLCLSQWFWACVGKAVMHRLECGVWTSLHFGDIKGVLSGMKFFVLFSYIEIYWMQIHVILYFAFKLLEGAWWMSWAGWEYIKTGHNRVVIQWAMLDWFVNIKNLVCTNLVCF